LYIVKGAIVKDTSGAPADLGVTAQVASTATTGTALSYSFQVTNSGANDSQGSSLTVKLPASVVYGQVTTTQGTCSGTGTFYCGLGTIAKNASVTVTASITPTVAGTIQATGIADAQTFDCNNANNQLTVSTTVTGSLYSPVPKVSQVLPNLVAAGSATFTLTVNGSNFTSASVIKWNGTALTTSVVNPGQLTASVDSSLIKQMGWGVVSVSSAAPGGGDSNTATVTIYSLLSVPANAMLYDPFTRKLWAALPSTSTSITGNSMVSVDPNTGTVGQPILVGSEPNLVTETSSGNYIYVGLSGAKALGRFNMSTQAIDATVPLSSTGYFGGDQLVRRVWRPYRGQIAV
jgi:hypothetical protein